MNEGYEVRVIEEKSGREVQSGEVFTDCRGESRMLRRVSRGPLPGSPARVIVSPADGRKYNFREVLAPTVGLRVEEVR